jgi:hypothetical protein
MAKRKPLFANRNWRLVYDDPPAIVDVAKRRTQFMLLSLHIIDYDLERLVTSAYLQGVNDTATVAFKNGFVPPQTAAFLEIGAGI